MFKPEQIRELLSTHPFKPFRICMSDGKTYEIKSHDTAIVGRTSVEIGINPDSEGFAEYFSRCAIMHITRIEDSQPA